MPEGNDDKRRTESPDRALIAGVLSEVERRPESRIPGVARGARLGGYHVVARLGRGAFAEVWRAREETLERDVALKLLRRQQGANGEAAFSEYLREARALSAAEHDHVVRIWNAGVLDGSRLPFISMELCVGSAAERKPLAPKEAARTLADVARGVASAHARGIVHRDIKPSNILFDSQGRAKLSDFGLSRPGLLPPSASPGAPDETQSIYFSDKGLSLLGTPAYMAPEQAQGGPATPLSDVYALGATLYYLLTGTSAYSFDASAGTGSLQELFAQITNPSHEPKPLPDTVPRPLARICQTAMSKEPEKRYQTAEKLAEDLEAWLAHRPTSADPPGRLRRSAMAARRNPIPTTLVLAVVVGISLCIRFALIVRKERDRAVNSEHIAQVFSERYVRLIDTIAQTDPKLRRAVKLISNEAIDSLQSMAGGGQRVEAVLQHAIGSSDLLAWDFSSAEPHFLRERQLLRESNEPFGENYWENARCLAELYYRKELCCKGRPFLDEAITGFQTNLGVNHPSTLRAMLWNVRYLTAESNNLGMVEQAWVDLAEQARKSLGELHETTLEAKYEFGLHLRMNGQPERAEQLLRDVFESRKATLGLDHSQTITAMNNLAVSLQDLRRYDEALDLLRETFEVHRRIWGPNHRETLICQGNLLMALRDRERWKEVEALALDAIPRCQDEFGPDEIFTWGPIFQLARAYMAQGNYEAAVEQWNKLLAIDALVRDKQQGGKALSLRGECLASLERYAEAEQDLLRGHEMLSGYFPVGTDHLIRSTQALIYLYEAWGKPTEAEVWRLAISEGQ